MSKRHEQLLFRYSTALEHGDFETVAALLHEAEHDPALEEMILQINEVYAAEQSGRFNHTNPKEIPMIAPLYQNRTQPRTQAYSLPMIAVITLVAVIGILLTPRLLQNPIWNTGQGGSPEPGLNQFDGSECTPPFDRESSSVKLYTRPAADARLAYEYFSNLFIPESNLSLLESVSVDGQIWHFVHIHGLSRDEMRGWMTEETFNKHVRCAPLANLGILTQVAAAGTPTLVPSPSLEPAAAAVAEGLSTFTPTPAPFNEDALVPSVIPDVVSAEANALPTLTPEATAIATPNFPVYTVQQGDTPRSILDQFNFDSSALRDFSIINQMPEDAVLTPGQEVLLPFNMPELRTTCTVYQGQSLDVLEERSDNGMILVTLPAETQFEITGEAEQPDGIWIEIKAQVHGATLVGGWVRLETMDFVTECRMDIVPTVEAAAMELMPTIAPAPVSVLTAEFPIYTVQEGDTLLSILTQFRLSVNRLDELLFINNLSEDAGSLPETLLIPVRIGRELLNCVVNQGETVELRQRPAPDAAEIVALAEGDVFRVIDESTQAGETWYMVTTQVDSSPIRSVWVNSEAISQRSDCQPRLSIAEADYPLPMLYPSNDAFGMIDCYVLTQTAINIYFTPSQDAEAEFNTEMPAGTQLRLIAPEVNEEGRWYFVTYYKHVNPVGRLYQGYVQADEIVLPAVCSAERVGATAQIQAITPTVRASPTPLPSSTPLASPTATPVP